MKSIFYPAIVAGLLAAAPAFATTIDFETAASFDSIGDYYATSGVSFGGDALAIQNDTLGTYFTNAPSPLGVMTAVGADATMNVLNGFTGLVSFFYASTDIATIGVYSGLNGTGDLLGVFDLFANATDGCSDSAFCNWTEATLSFLGIAKSITFGDAANVADGAAFDNVSFTAASNSVPEPSTVLLLGLGLTALVSSRRRAAK